MKQDIDKNHNHLQAVVHSISTINGYGAAWSLARAGVPVVGLWADRNPMVYSKLTRENIRVPDENSHGEELIGRLVDLGKQAKSRRVLYMMSDLGAFLASTHREQLEPYYIHPWMTWDQVKATLHRKTMFEIAESAGVALPRTWFSSNDNWSDIDLQKLPYPLILKPMVSRFGFDNETVTNAWTFTNKYGRRSSCTTQTSFAQCYQTWYPTILRFARKSASIARSATSGPTTSIALVAKSRPSSAVTRYIKSLRILERVPLRAPSQIQTLLENQQSFCARPDSPESETLSTYVRMKATSSSKSTLEDIIGQAWQPRAASISTRLCTTIWDWALNRHGPNRLTMG